MTCQTIKVIRTWCAVEADKNSLDIVSLIDKSHCPLDVAVSALKMIVGESPCVDNLLSNVEIAQSALEKIKCTKSA